MRWGHGTRGHAHAPLVRHECGDGVRPDDRPAAGTDARRRVRRSPGCGAMVARTARRTLASAQPGPGSGRVVRPPSTRCGLDPSRGGGSWGRVLGVRRDVGWSRRHHAAGCARRGDLERWRHPGAWRVRCRHIGPRPRRGLLRTGQRPVPAASDLGSDGFVGAGAPAGDARALGLLRMASVQLVRCRWTARASVPAMWGTGT